MNALQTVRVHVRYVLAISALLAGHQAAQATEAGDPSLRQADAATAPASKAAPGAPAQFGHPELKYAWTRTMWAFRTKAERQAYLKQGLYAKAPLHGVKVDAQGRVYVTVARILDGRVPATLNRVTMQQGKPVLAPYPSWEANQLGSPGALQNVLGFEIDSHNRMWALDMGFAGGAARPASDVEQKIVVFDLGTNKEIRRIPIPAAVADPSTSFLNDIALDEGHNKLYISDTGLRSASDGAASGIIVVDLATNQVRRVLHRAPSTRDDLTHPLTVNGEAVFPGNPLRAGINGIALTPDGTRLYWSITTGDAVYAIDTRYLHDATLSDEAIQAHVEGPIRIGGGSDALSMDSLGRVYITNISKGQVQVLDPKLQTMEVIASGPGFIWPDTFGWDAQGGLWVSTNHLNRVFAGKANFNRRAPNFRIYRIQTNAMKGHALSAAP